MLAARAVTRVLGGARIREALAEVDDGSALRGRALVQELTYGTLRHWGTLDALAGALVRKPIAEPLLRSLVAVAIYQLDHTRAPAFAVVDRAVFAAGELVRPGAKALVNAVLRRYLRERESINEAVNADDVARWSHPRWWIERLRRDHPQDWQSILEAGNVRPPLTLRVNQRVMDRPSLLRLFEANGITAKPAGEIGVIVDDPQPVTALPGFDAGAFAVQDLGAQLAAPLLEIEPGMRVLDACAAPGGKTAHMLDTPRIDVVAVDADADRLRRVVENLTRLRVDDDRVAIVQGDAGTPAAWWSGQPFDRILLDVPCTASGVVRRHPDGKWRHRASDVERFAREQARLLDAAWPLLVPGGKLLYATCSVFAAENDDRVTNFVAHHNDALRETLTFPADAAHRDGQLLPSPSAAGHNQDGFFYARLRKR